MSRVPSRLHGDRRSPEAVQGFPGCLTQQSVPWSRLRVNQGDAIGTWSALTAHRRERRISTDLHTLSGSRRAPGSPNRLVVYTKTQDRAELGQIALGRAYLDRLAW